MGDARKYEHVPSNSYDVALSFGVFFYFDNVDEVLGLATVLTGVRFGRG